MNIFKHILVYLKKLSSAPLTFLLTYIPGKDMYTMSPPEIARSLLKPAINIVK